MASPAPSAVATLADLAVAHPAASRVFHRHGLDFCCHGRRLRAELPELISLAAKVETRHAEKGSCPRGLRAHLEEVHRAVLEHLAKEEQVLFPMILGGRGRMAGG